MPIQHTTHTFRDNLWKGIFAVSGIMLTLVIYGVLQEKIMRIPYGVEKEYFKYSLFLVFCNRIMTSAVSAGSLLANSCEVCENDTSYGLGYNYHAEETYAESSMVQN
ncbi:unnamed protein product [Lathyrus oleraceus]